MCQHTANWGGFKTPPLAVKTWPQHPAKPVTTVSHLCKISFWLFSCKWRTSQLFVPKFFGCHKNWAQPPPHKNYTVATIAQKYANCSMLYNTSEQIVKMNWLSPNSEYFILASATLTLTSTDNRSIDEATGQNPPGNVSLTLGSQHSQYLDYRTYTSPWQTQCQQHCGHLFCQQHLQHKMSCIDLSSCHTR